MSTTSGSADYGRFDELAEEFAARYRRGERPALQEYIDRAPDLADQIRDLFPALVQVEQAEEALQGPAGPAPAPGAGGSPGRVGDYRILREVGRGGMGVVYEAEQVSLGRRVALKVLPRHVAPDRKALERFRREARSAARLHHTNIVPVYEVGRDGEVVFYAMQFIQGQGLDLVIDELSRLRDGSRKSASAAEGRDDAAPAPAAEAPARAVHRMAESLLTGRFAPGAGPGETWPTAGPGPAVDPGVTEPFDPDATSGHGAGPVAPGPTLPGSDDSNSAVLPGGGAVSAVEASGRRLPFFRSIAEVGLQAAQGLAYAHARGVIHRDVKPSNLLLDTTGVVWITDFGLAKAEEDGLTQTGDILGTFRYMAPERFRGEGDARVDVYALGLTLYELLTLRPAFDSADRLRLVEQIKGEEPIRPRLLDPRIPRDLETIVLKAMEKDADRRYPNAEALAEDLRRFLADEPIRARRASAAERTARWARRNPAIAALGAVLTGVLILATVGSLLAAGRMAVLAENRQKAMEGEKLARQAAQRDQRAAEAARAHEAGLREQADRARRQVEAALKDARDQRSRAEANFARSRAAVDDYLTKVSESQLLKVPGLQPLRGELLQSALGFYQEFLRERGDDPTIRAGLASAQLRAGRILGDLGRFVEARRALEQAQRLYQELTRLDPTDREALLGLAESHLAAGSYRESIAAGEALLRLDPADARGQRCLAAAYNGAAFQGGGSNVAQAQLDSLRKALALREALVRRDPDDPEARRDLGGTLNNLGVMLNYRNRQREALTMFQRAVEHSRVAYDRVPQVIPYGQFLAVALRNVGNSRWDFGEKEAALPWFREANDVWDRLAAENPSVPSLLASYLQSSEDLGRKFAALDRGDDAARMARRARALVERMPRRTAPELYRLACVRALCAAPPARPGAEAPLDDPAERSRALDQAMDALTRAVAAGYKDSRALAANEDLAALRDRADYKALVAGLEVRTRLDQLAAVAGPPAERLKANREALSLRESLAAAAPKDRSLQADLAASRQAIGLIQLDLGDADGAARTLAEALAIRERLAADDPKSPRPRADLAASCAALGDLHWKLDRRPEAVREWRRGADLLETALRDAPADADLTVRLAGAEIALGDRYGELTLWAEAAEWLGKGLGRRPLDRDNDGVRRYGFALMAAGDGAGHRRLRDRVRGELLGPDQPPYAASVAAAVLDMVPDGDPDLERVVAAAGRGAEATAQDGNWQRLEVGQAEYRAGRYAEAVRILDQPKFQWSARASAFAAMAHHRLGHAGPAADCLARSGAKMEEVRRYFFVAQGPRAWGLWWQLPEEDAIWREATLLLTGSPPPADPRAHLHRGQAYLSLGEPAKAEAEFAAALALRPDDPATRLACGLAFDRADRADRARAEFARFEALKSTDPRPWLDYGRHLDETGRRAEADAALAAAARLTAGELNRFLDDRWWIAGPYPADFNVPCPPEHDPDPSKAVAALGGPGPLTWRAVPVGPRGNIELGDLLKTKAGESAYALNFVYAPEPRAATLLVGGNERTRLWVNGRFVHETTAARGEPWNLDRVPVTLKAGRNTILARVLHPAVGHDSDTWHVLLCRLADTPEDRVIDLGLRGLWPEAAAAARRIRPGPRLNSWWLAQRAILDLVVGDRAGYEEVSREMATRPADDGNVIWMAVLDPGSGFPMDRIVEGAKKNVRPAESWTRHGLAMAYYRAGRFAESAAEWEATDEGAREPGLAMAYHRLGRADDAERVLAAARDWLKDLIRSFRDQPRAPAFVNWGWYVLASRSILYDEAFRLIRGADARLDVSLEPLYAAARAGAKSADPATAEFDVAIKAYPDQPRLYLARADRLAELGRAEEAAADFSKVVELKPDASFWKARGLAAADRGRIDEAAAAFAEALAGVPGDRTWNSPRSRLIVGLAARDGAFSRLMELRPGDVDLHLGRGRYHAMRGEWSRALADYERYLPSAPAGCEEWTEYAALLLLAGDAPGYRAFARGLARREGGTADPIARFVLARTCGLGADLGVDPEQLIGWARLAFSHADKPWYHHALGLALYRAGRYPEAIQAMERSNAGAWDESGRTQNRLVLAMAHQRLGESAKARDLLGQARAWLAGVESRMVDGAPVGIPAVDWLPLLVLAREAEALILLDPAFPADPFVR